jgi:hypothetical protein
MLGAMAAGIVPAVSAMCPYVKSDVGTCVLDRLCVYFGLGRNGHGRSIKKGSPPQALEYYGGDEEDRTPDLRIANATLSQLSYVPIFSILSTIRRYYNAAFSRSFRRRHACRVNIRAALQASILAIQGIRACWRDSFFAPHGVGEHDDSADNHWQ